MRIHHRFIGGLPVLHTLILFSATSIVLGQAPADPPAKGAVPARQGVKGAAGAVLPKPDVADAKYGPHERNVLDLWKSKSEKPTPIVVYIHGGGFRAGDKNTLNPALLDGLLKAGISVAAINYRLSQHAIFPAPFHDSARAIQFLRSKSAEWNLDPTKIGATGGSAGAGMSLWLGFHPDPLAVSQTQVCSVANDTHKNIPRAKVFLEYVPWMDVQTW